MEDAAETHLLCMLAQEGESHSMLVIYDEVIPVVSCL